MPAKAGDMLQLVGWRQLVGDLLALIDPFLDSTCVPIFSIRLQACQSCERTKGANWLFMGVPLLLCKKMNVTPIYIWTRRNLQNLFLSGVVVVVGQVVDVRRADDMEGVTATTTTRKIMVVADHGRESAGALQWALSHCVIEHDELILLHVQNSASWRNSFTFFRRPSQNSSSASVSIESAHGGGVDLEFLEVMKRACEAMQPKVRVHIERVDMEGKDKASTILNQCKTLSVDVLVIGQRRSISNAILGCRLSGGSTKGMDNAEYLIENCKCTCVGVQKKGQNGGYVLNTKTHRNFWLLA